MQLDRAGQGRGRVSRRQRRRASRGPAGQVAHDPLGVALHPGDRVRRHRIQEVQAHEIEPGRLRDDPGFVGGFLAVAEDGQVDPGEPGAVSGAPDDVGRFEHAAVLEDRQPVLDARDPPHPLHPGREQVLRLDPNQRRGGLQQPRPELAPERAAHRQDMLADEPDHADEAVTRDERLDPERHRAGLLAGQPGRMVADDFHRNVGPGVADADQQHRALPQLRGVAVVLRVQLHNSVVEVRGERRRPGDLMVAHRDDDVGGADVAAVRRHQKRVAVPGEPGDPHAGVHRQLELAGVGLQVIGHLVFADERPGGGRKAHSRQPVVTRGCEQQQRVPPVAPGVTHPRVRVEDHKRAMLLAEVVPDRQPCLATADHDGVDFGRPGVCSHSCLPAGLD